MDPQWVLELTQPDGARVSSVISPLPFRVGREPDSELVIDAPGVSRRHAVLTRDISGLLKLSDLNSTNGCFVNRARIEGARLLHDGDLLHFAGAEFRLRTQRPELAGFAHDSQVRTQLVPDALTADPDAFPEAPSFNQLIEGYGLSGAAQPIVHAHDFAKVFGYELLGRASHPLLPTQPADLFQIASLLGREVDLSRAFRDFGIHTIAPCLRGFPLFANTHPKETFEPAFFEQLIALRAGMPDLQLVVEIHESAVTEVRPLRELVARFREIGVRFAYDDFGIGQARLNELGDATADFVKFDMSLLHDLHLASERKRRVVRDLVKLVRDLGSQPIAEGIEMQAEADLCLELGFTLLQGYLTGRPIPAEQLF
ncbi:MAG: EAL domain-containing protein [Candidatus Dactylopiibacterium sp.]|nr:EAL domain-containing protein [Candidatus Dactylopiibacterium sp.]